MRDDDQSVRDVIDALHLALQFANSHRALRLADRLTYLLLEVVTEGHMLVLERTWRAAEKRRLTSALPANPLAMAIGRAARRSFHDDPAERIRKEIGVSQRHVFAWRTRGRDVSLDTADKALIALGLLWFDVWNEDTVRRPVLEVRCYLSRTKFSPWHPEHRWRGRELTRRDWYGDKGTDWEELDRIEALMIGEPVEMAA